MIAIGWQASSYFGWGVYGINLALELAKREIAAVSTHIVRMEQLALDKLRLNLMAPFIRRTNAQQPLPGDAVLLDALGNEFLSAPESRARIGVVFFEQPLSPAAIERARSYDTIIAGSTWNAKVLRGHGLDNVKLLIQGVDRSLFHPAPRRNLYPGRFLIFSGGKAEPRKGQDIVVAAFRVFAKRHPEAMLVTAWHSPWPQLRKGMDLDLSEFNDRVLDVGHVANGQMASIYRECHVGLFPNRCEGGTNLVAMEAMACGLPCIVSQNTGHLDLFDLTDAYPIKSMHPTGEPDLDEVLAYLERAFDDPAGGGRLVRGNGLYQDHDRLPGWDVTADGIVEAVNELRSGA